MASLTIDLQSNIKTNREAFVIRQRKKTLDTPLCVALVLSKICTSPHPNLYIYCTSLRILLKNSLVVKNSSVFAISILLNDYRLSLSTLKDIVA